MIKISTYLKFIFLTLSTFFGCGVHCTCSHSNWGLILLQLIQLKIKIYKFLSCQSTRQISRIIRSFVDLLFSFFSPVFYFKKRAFFLSLSYSFLTLNFNIRIQLNHASFMFWFDCNGVMPETRRSVYINSLYGIALSVKRLSFLPLIFQKFLFLYL